MRNAPRLAALLFSMASAAGLVPVTADAAIVSTTGAVDIISPPVSVRTDQLVSDQSIFGFLETSKLTLAADLQVDANSPGVHRPPEFDPNPLPVIAAGTKISSYFFHSDSTLPSDSGSEQVFQYFASITFDRDILGIIFSASRLFATDALLGSPLTIYELDDGTRGFELGPICGADLNDCAEISADLRTLTLSWSTGTRLDELRVITAVPEPSSLALFATVLIALAAWQGRRMLSAPRPATLGQ